MADVVFYSLVALAKAGIECCQNAQVYKAEAVRIGERLTMIVALARQWRGGCSNEQLECFHRVVVNVHECMKAAFLSESKSVAWNRKLKVTLQSQMLLENLVQAESQLNTAIADFQVMQSNTIFSDFLDFKEGVKEMLDRFGSCVMNQSGSVTIKQQFDQVLAETQDQAPEIGISTPEDGRYNATIKYDPAGQTGGKLQQRKKSMFRPSEEDVLAITLRPSLLVFCDDRNNLLGGGGFAEVFHGTYDGRPVAIKRLNVSIRDVMSLSTKQITSDVEQLAAEAILTHKCGAHSNIIQVLGCITALNKTTRPLLVMELMHITLFDALHDHRVKDKLTFSHCLFLLKGIAGALEFLHLQGIVHHDIKSLNILLSEDLTVAKLADFGESKVKGLNTTKPRLERIMTTSCHQGNIIAGTAAYQAPEILSEDVNDISRVCEVYSFGVTVWECVTREIPHMGKKEGSIALLAANKKHLPMLAMPLHPSKDLPTTEIGSWEALRKVAALCLSRDRSMRPTASGVVELWHHVDTPSFPPESLCYASTRCVSDPPLPAHSASQKSTIRGHALDAPDFEEESKAGGLRKRRYTVLSVIAILIGLIVIIVLRLQRSRASSGKSTTFPESEAPSGISISTLPPTQLPRASLIPQTEAPVSLSPPTGPPLSSQSLTTQPSSTSMPPRAGPVSTPPPTISPLTAQSPTTSTQPRLSFQTTQELYDAVDIYTAATDSTNSTAAVTYGYPIGSWDVSQITDFSQVFDSLNRNSAVGIFDEDVSGWDVSAATTMSGMFKGASTFSGDLSLWNVSQVRDTSSMFEGATSFDGNVSLWNVGQVTNMSSMFFEASAFNGDLASWNVGQVTNMSSIFFLASSFTSDLSSWNVAQVTDWFAAFKGAAAFTSDLSKWNVGKVTNMRLMFYHAFDFNSDLTSWDVSQVTDLSSMLEGATAFTGNLCSWLTQIPPSCNVDRMFSFASSCSDLAATVLPDGPMCHACVPM
jgi:surface protein